MKKDRVNLPTALLLPNLGQLEWLPKNPRQWTQDDIDRTAKSIREDEDFLEDRPLLVTPQGKKWIIFAGNLRRTAAAQAGVKTLPCVVYQPETDGDYDTIKRRAMKDNGSFGSWDYDTLANDWGDLPLTDWGVPVWDADKEEEAAGGAGGAAAQEDDFDEDKDEIHVRCKKGDIWQLGEHRLMCGDSTDLDTVKSLMGGALADMVFTDPPYGVSIGDKNKTLREKVGGKSIVRNIENDTLPVDELYQVLKSAMENVRLNCKGDASYYVTAPQGGGLGLMMMMMMMRDAGLEVRHNLVWRKNAPTFSLGRLDYDYQHEPIMYTWTEKHHNYRNGKYRTTIWDFDKPRKCDLHPTMKPVELVANCMLDCTKEGDLVLDAFGGSGTTIIAAEQLGRRACLMELDPHYCDVIIARWEKLTGKTATKLN